jgi:hypothetical protein
MQMKHTVSKTLKISNFLFCLAKAIHKLERRLGLSVYLNVVSEVQNAVKMKCLKKGT